MIALGIQSKREITRTRIRVRTAMAAQAREQGRYLGGRPPYGYRLADAGPHPNREDASRGRRAHRWNPRTAPVARWIFAQRLAGYSVARITRALNDAATSSNRRLVLHPGARSTQQPVGWQRSYRGLAAMAPVPRQVNPTASATMLCAHRGVHVGGQVAVLELAAFRRAGRA